MAATASYTVQFSNAQRCGYWRARILPRPARFLAGSLNVRHAGMAAPSGWRGLLKRTPRQAVSQSAVAEWTARCAGWCCNSISRPSNWTTVCASRGTAELRRCDAGRPFYEGSSQRSEWFSEAEERGSRTHDPEQESALADLPVYLRQHHPARDRASSGRTPPCSRGCGVVRGLVMDVAEFGRRVGWLWWLRIRDDECSASAAHVVPRASGTPSKSSRDPDGESSQRQITTDQR